MGNSKSKKQETNSTVGPPQYVQDAYQSLVGQAQNTAAQPFVPYGGQTVAGLTPEQEAGISATMAAAGKADPYFGKASGYLDQSAASISPMAFSGDALQQFMNPFQQSVIDSTLATTAENDRRQQQDLTGKAIMSGAWGGDRAGVAKAELARQQKLGADSTLAGLNMQNFNQALQAFQQQQGVDLAARQSDAARAAGAGSAFAGLGQAAQDSALKDALAQMQAGGVRQQNTQQQLSSDYDQFLQQQAYPFQSQGWLANLLTGIGSSAGSTSNSVTKGSDGGGAGGVLGAVTSGIGIASKVLPMLGFSDERIKEDIEQVGETFDGQPIYRYRYKGDPRTQIGLMAQDVEEENPDAVYDINGVKALDYKAATDNAARGVAGGQHEFADGGVVPYAGRVKSRIPDMQPIKGRTGLMTAPAAPSLGAQPQQQPTDFSKLGGQIGDLIGKGKEAFGGSSDANTPRFEFQSGKELFGPGFARGGIVDMEQDSSGAFRPAYEIGGGVAPLGDEPNLFGSDPIGDEPVMFMPPRFNPARFDAVAPAVAPAPKVAAAEPDLRGGPGGFTPSDIDAIVRTVYGEAARESPEGQRAVAEVIRNRAMQGDMTPTDVVLAPGQFEPWGSRREELQNLDPNSPQYKAILANVLPVVEGTAPDVTDQSDHFYSPKAQAALGRPMPRWDDGTGVDVGNHRFFEHGYGGHPGGSGIAVARSVTGGSGPRATAYGPEEGQRLQTTAFDGLKPSSGVAAAVPQVKEAVQKGFLPDDVSDALIAAGLAMMASRSSSPWGALGEGGLAGLQYYRSGQEAKRKTAQEERETARKTLVEDRTFGHQERTLAQRAQEARERLGLTERQVSETERANKAREDKSKYSVVSGTGVDAEGNTVPGSYVFDQGTGDMVFKPGAVTGAPKRDPEVELQRKSEFDKLKELDAAAEAARGVKSGVSTLRDMRKGVWYEGMPGAGIGSSIAGAIGYGGGQALEAQATQFKLDLSGKLKGAISDKEQAMLSSATPGLGMSDDAANRTLDVYEGAASRAVERKKFYETWRARNKSLVGADDAWDRYIEQNPVIQADKNGELTLNRKNLGNWQKYVVKTGKDGQPATGQSPPVQRNARSGSDLPVMQTPADAQKLPPGTLYRTPDGKEYTR